jgi:hypothetical protein
VFQSGRKTITITPSLLYQRIDRADSDVWWSTAGLYQSFYDIPQPTTEQCGPVSRWRKQVRRPGARTRDSSSTANRCRRCPQINWGPAGITVNAIHPGVVQTEHIVELFQTEACKRGVTPGEIEAEYASATPIRRIIKAEEVGYAVAFLGESYDELVDRRSGAHFVSGVHLRPSENKYHDFLAVS